MATALIRKLEVAGGLIDEDKAVLERLCERSRLFAGRLDLTRAGDRPENVHLITQGFACRYKMLPGGERHVMAVLVPGDLCDLHVAILGQMDHAIATISPCRVVTIPRATVLELTEHHPRINRALWWATLVDEAILREWLVNLALRSADERLAHLFCEMLVRLSSVGLSDGASCDLPLTQADFAEILGLTPVHLNRTLQELRAAGLVELRARHLSVPDVERLRAFCDFNPNYLHLTPRR